MSVLLLILDGVSHSGARRYLKETYKYLTVEREAITIKGYHSVGKNTFPNMLPLTTGNINISARLSMT